MSAGKRRLDSYDLKILAMLQKDANIPISALADAVNLSTTPCWRRVKALRESGVISGEVALLDPVSVNLGMTVFVAVRTRNHTAEWFDHFRGAIEAIPEVIELHRLSGDIDYLLRVVVPDIKAYDDVYKRLIRAVELEDVSSSFVMETVKTSTALPLDYVQSVPQSS